MLSAADCAGTVAAGECAKCCLPRPAQGNSCAIPASSDPELEGRWIICSRAFKHTALTVCMIKQNCFLEQAAMQKKNVTVALMLIG